MNDRYRSSVNVTINPHRFISDPHWENVSDIFDPHRSNINTTLLTDWHLANMNVIPDPQRPKPFFFLLLYRVKRVLTSSCMRKYHKSCFFFFFFEFQDLVFHKKNCFVKIFNKHKITTNVMLAPDNKTKAQMNFTVAYKRKHCTKTSLTVLTHIDETWMFLLITYMKCERCYWSTLTKQILSQAKLINK